jgi:hypothetical protein
MASSWRRSEIALALIGCGALYLLARGPASFTSEAWADARARSDGRRLVALAELVVDRKLLVGASEDDVVRLLGTPTERWPRRGSDRERGRSVVTLGYRLSDRFGWPGYLIVDLPGGTVESANLSD